MRFKLKQHVVSLGLEEWAQDKGRYICSSSSGCLTQIVMTESKDTWRRCVSESYKKWKAEEWDPANDQEQAVLHKSLEIRMDEEFTQETSAQRVKNTGKQFSALVSISLCVVWT